MEVTRITIPSRILIAPPQASMPSEPAAERMRLEMDWSGNADGYKYQVCSRGRSLPALFGRKGSNERDKRNPNDREQQCASSGNYARGRSFPFAQGDNRE